MREKRRTSLLSFKISLVQDGLTLFYTTIFSLPYQHIILTRKLPLKEEALSWDFLTYLLSKKLVRTLHPFNSKI